MTYLYGIYDNQSNELLKYGITFSPAKRYPRWYYDRHKADMQIIGYGPDRRLVEKIEYDLVSKVGGPLNRESYSSYRKNGPAIADADAVPAPGEAMSQEEANLLGSAGANEPELELSSALADVDEGLIVLPSVDVGAEANLIEETFREDQENERSMGEICGWGSGIYEGH